MNSTTYEQWLAADLSLGFEDASRHFEGRSRVHLALRRLVKLLDALGIPYAVAGDMAMFFHGYRRFTEILEILIGFDDLLALHKHRDALGYVLDSLTGMDLRDSQFGVRIHFLTSGTPRIPELPMPVNYPDPAKAAVAIDGLHLLSLPALIELKLAWGMKGPRQLRHLGDVQCLIDELKLPRDFGDQLDPLVRGKFWEMWMDVENDPCRGMY